MTKRAEQLLNTVMMMCRRVMLKLSAKTDIERKEGRRLIFFMILRGQIEFRERDTRTRRRKKQRTRKRRRRKRTRMRKRRST